MDNFEKKMQQELKEETPLSAEARIAFDNAYTVIATKNKQKKFGFYQPVFMKYALAVIMLLLLFTVTPIGSATINYFFTDIFTNQTLKEQGFVTKQSSATVNKDITIQLAEVYADDNELGLHFIIDFPKDSPLKKKTIKNYALNFALQKNDKVLLDKGTNLSQQSLNGTLTDTQYYDQKKQKLHINYRYQAKNMLHDLRDAKVVVTKITGYYAKSDAPGYHELKEGEDFITLTGSWELPITDSKIADFKTLHYALPNINETVQATVTPTTLTITLPKNSVILTESDYKNIYVTPFTQQVATKYPVENIRKVTQAGDEYTQLSFDYHDYDQATQFILSVGEKEYIFYKV